MLAAMNIHEWMSYTQFKLNPCDHIRQTNFLILTLSKIVEGEQIFTDLIGDGDFGGDCEANSRCTRLATDVVDVGSVGRSHSVFGYEGLGCWPWLMSSWMYYRHAENVIFLNISSSGSYFTTILELNELFCVIDINI